MCEYIHIHKLKFTSIILSIKLTKISKWQNSVVGSVKKKLALTILLVDMHTENPFLESGFEIFNQSIWKDSHPLCQICTVPYRSSLHPFLTCQHPGRLT